MAAVASLCGAFACAETVERDVVIYGSTPAAITAAIEAQKMGRTAVIVSPETRIGGMTTGGLGATDVGSRAAYGGLSLKFYRDIRTYYRDVKNWKWEKPLDYAQRSYTFRQDMDDAMWFFSPSAALAVLESWEKEHKLDIRRGEWLDRAKGKVKVEGEGEQRRIVSLVTLSGNVYRGKVFLDTTYEGDLMAAAGVSYFVGREDNSVYGETLSGYQPTPRHGGHRLKGGIDPYRVKGDPKSGLLPGVLPHEAVKDRKVGSGDRNLQAYNYRMCLTDVEANRIPFKKPAGYDEGLYELLFRNYEAGQKELPRNQAIMPDRKTDTNNHSGFSTDFIGQNWNWPEASYEERAKMAQAHLTYQQGLMWTLANHPRIPEDVRVEFSRWGTCKDEFADGPGDGWPSQIYVREARRMVGEYVMTEHDCRRTRVSKRPVAMASYGMDSHNTMRYVDADGFVRNEGDIQDWQASGIPYGIDYGALVPKRGECANLLVPVCVSSSHMAFGSIRMEPVFFALGQAAGAAAALAAGDGVAVQDVDYAKLRRRLVLDGQYLEDKSDALSPIVPIKIGARDYDDQLAALRRLNEEYGIKRAFIIGCPGHAVRLNGWEKSDERYEKFADLLARIKRDLSDTDLEIGWWNSPTITIGHGGPYQMMVGGDGTEAQHAVCQLDPGFRAELVRRVKLIAAKTQPWAIQFEDENHFGWQRNVKKFTCYCPLHLRMVGERIGRAITREELVAICENPTDDNLPVRAAFAESMRETMRILGRELRAAVDEVSPMTRMGTCYTADVGRDGDALIAFARELAGPGRPFIRNGCSNYGWNMDAPDEVGCRLGNPLSEYENLPADFETFLELDAYPHNRFAMSDAKFEGMMSSHVALGVHDILYYGVINNDDPLEQNGYFDVWKRCGKKLNALKKALQGKHVRGVQLVNKHSSDNLFRYAGVPGLVSGSAMMSRYGFPFTTHEMPAKLLIGIEAKRLSDADLERLLTKGGVLIDGEAAEILCARGYEELIGAHVDRTYLPAASERVRATVGNYRLRGRIIPNNAFAAVGTEHGTTLNLTNLRAGAEVLSDLCDFEGEPKWPSVYRYVNARGARIAVTATSLTENRSASVYYARKRELYRIVFEWLANNPFGLYATVADEQNVFLFASTANDEQEMVLTAVNMRMDTLPKLDILLSPWWKDASVEEADAEGVWKPGDFTGPCYPGQARVFRLRRRND